MKERRIQYEVCSDKDVIAWNLEVAWMVDVHLSTTNETPMWAGWNTKRSPKIDLVQKVWYLPQINQSPTSSSVVLETMKRSQDIAKEADRGSIAVTYDLAIAKIAWQIQNEERPIFYNVFVALGAFHVELLLFAAFGKVIAESGGPYILNESEVLASASLKSFRKGKNYKRCKRMHELLALAMEVLHLKRFLKEEGDNGVPILEEIAIKRTTKPFSASPIDLTLEQTINADAASQRTGISSLTNSISARQRWAESHYLRTMLNTIMNI